MSKVEILHERDPDSACSVRVWIDGQEVDGAHVDDIDPGRGYTEGDWQANVQKVLSADTSPEFKRAALAAYTESGDSEYVSPAPNTECKHCERRIVDAGGIWVDPEAPLDLDEDGNLTDDGIWRETCDRHDTLTAEHEPA